MVFLAQIFFDFPKMRYGMSTHETSMVRFGWGYMLQFLQICLCPQVPSFGVVFLVHLAKTKRFELQAKVRSFFFELLAWYQKNFFVVLSQFFILSLQRWGELSHSNQVMELFSFLKRSFATQFVVSVPTSVK